MSAFRSSAAPMAQERIANDGAAYTQAELIDSEARGRNRWDMASPAPHGQESGAPQPAVDVVAAGGATQPAPGKAAVAAPENAAAAIGSANDPEPALSEVIRISEEGSPLAEMAACDIGQSNVHERLEEVSKKIRKHSQNVKDQAAVHDFRRVAANTPESSTGIGAAGGAIPRPLDAVAPEDPQPAAAVGAANGTRPQVDIVAATGATQPAAGVTTGNHAAALPFGAAPAGGAITPALDVLAPEAPP